MPFKAMKLQIPLAPATSTLDARGCVIKDQSGKRLLLYCPVTLCGAVFNLEAKFWTMQQPIKFSEWLTALEANEMLPRSDNAQDLAIWIENCTGDVAGGRC